jgi:hypothetical protein
MTKTITTHRKPVVKPRIKLRDKSCAPDVRLMDAIASGTPLDEQLAILDAWTPRLTIISR